MDNFYLFDELLVYVWIIAFGYVVGMKISYLLDKLIDSLWNYFNVDKKIVLAAQNISTANEKLFKNLYYNNSAFHGIVKVFETTIPNKVTRTLNKIFVYFQDK